jgi:phage RecT family recombinase
MSDQKQLPSPARQSREQFLATVAAAGKEFGVAAPLSVDRQQVARSVDRVMVSFRQQSAANPTLLECTPASVARAIALSALTGLLPGGPLPDVYLLPQKVAGQQTLDWRISWRGYVTLCARAGYRLRAVHVFDGDEFDYCEGLVPDLTHRPAQDAEQSWDTMRAVYVVAHPVQAGPPVFMVVPRRIIEARRAVSQSRDNGPWRQWPLEMALKAAIRYAVQRGLVPLDDVAAYAHGEDADVIEAPTEQAPAQTRRPTATARDLLLGADEAPADEPPPAPVRRSRRRQEEPPADGFHPSPDEPPQE